MSNRAPNALDIPERRASQPSSPSSTVATIAAAAAAAAMTGTLASPMTPATRATSAARAMVTQLAGPNVTYGWFVGEIRAATTSAMTAKQADALSANHGVNGMTECYP